MAESEPKAPPIKPSPRVHIFAPLPTPDAEPAVPTNQTRKPKEQPSGGGK